MNERKKHCPFCDSDDIRVYKTEDGYTIQCNVCIANIPYNQTIKIALNNWNHRK